MVRTCHYCDLPKHIQRFCYKLHERLSQRATVNVSDVVESSAFSQFAVEGKLIRMSDEEFARYNQLHISQPVSQSFSIATFVQTDTTQQNGVAEQKNRHLLEVARSLMFEMK